MTKERQPDSGKDLPPLPPIPAPPSILWRTIRMNWVPPVVFLASVAFVFIQWRSLTGGAIPGIAEGIRSVVTAPQISLLHELKVVPYQWVESGQPLATLMPIDPRMDLDILQSELQLARLRMEPSLAERNAIDYERLRIECVRLKQEVAMAEVNLQRAESALKRSVALRSENLVSEDEYDLNLRDRDLYQVEVKEKRDAVADVEKRLEQLRVLADPEGPASHLPTQPFLDRLGEAIHGAQVRKESMLVVAPISGMVQYINRQPGEYLTEGEPLVTILSPKSERIVAYLRQPYSREPEVGMSVKVRTRDRSPRAFVSHITHVGAQLEPITNSIALVRPDILVDVGLPVVIEVPPAVHLRPGEAVDVVLLPTRSASPNGALSRAPAHAKQP